MTFMQELTNIMRLALTEHQTIDSSARPHTGWPKNWHTMFCTP